MLNPNFNSYFKTEIEPSTDFPLTGKPSAAETIVAIIPRGEALRNFVYTGALECVSEKANLSLISVSPNESVIKMLAETYGDVHRLEEFDERWIVRLQREIIATAHNRWLWSKAAQERARLRGAEAQTRRQKAKWLVKKAISYPFASRTGLRTLSSAERFSSRVFRTSDEYLKLMKKLKPALVFNCSHVHSRVATQAVQAAQWLGIPTATFIFSWDNLTSQGRILLPYDYFLVWNKQLKRQLLEMYEWVREEQVFVTGTPQFDFHFRPEFYQSREEFCLEIGANPSRPIVLYSTGMANHMPGEPEIVEELADFLKEIAPQDAPQLLVRVYPKDLTGRFDELKQRRKDILFPRIAWEESWLTPKIEDSYALVNTLRHSAFGINVASTISLELCMFDKPALNVGYNPPSVDEKELSYATYYNFDHYRPLVESGAVEVAWNRAQMRELMREAILHPQQNSEKRQAFIKRMFGDTLDGKSAGRVAEVLLEIASKRSRLNQTIA
jgi:hypothetical protein